MSLHRAGLRTERQSARLVVLALLLTLSWWGSSAARGQDERAPSQQPQPQQSLKSRTMMVSNNPLGVLQGLGWFVWPLGLTSIVVVWFSVERMVVLRRGRVIPRPFVKRFFDHLQQGKLDPRAAMGLCEENGSPIAIILAHGIRKWGRPSVEVEQAIIDGGERQVSHLRSHLRVLNGASNVAPMLGLLGTVVGMIDSFSAIAAANAMGKTQELAAGIGLALLTTAAGLLIAIPAMIMYTYLAGKVDALVIEMDSYAQLLVDHISAEGLAEQARMGRQPPVERPSPKPEPRSKAV